jgi:hypothetical protein
MPIIPEVWIPEFFLPQLMVLRKRIFERLLPTFDDIEAEANRVENDAFQRLIANANEDSDEASLAEAAFNVGLEHFQLLAATQQTVINAFVIALSHLFEQQRHLLSFQTLLDVEPNSRKRDEGFEEFLKNNNIDTSTFTRNQKLKELELVANVAKHAEGQSAERLRELRPELFVYPSHRNDPDLQWLSNYKRPVNESLAGEGFFVEPDDLRAYFDATESFWEFVLHRLTDSSKTVV